MSNLQWTNIDIVYLDHFTGKISLPRPWLITLGSSRCGLWLTCAQDLLGLRNSVSWEPSECPHEPATSRIYIYIDRNGNSRKGTPLIRFFSIPCPPGPSAGAEAPCRISGPFFTACWPLYLLFLLTIIYNHRVNDTICSFVFDCLISIQGVLDYVGIEIVRSRDDLAASNVPWSWALLEIPSL